MTKRECAIVMAYTDTVMLSGDNLKYLYQYLEEISGPPVWTHEIPAICGECRERIKQDFIRLCENTKDG